MNPERLRLEQTARREKHWRRWGPYLSERAWGTVREDYSPYGTAWEYFPHDHARSRAYRWSEDGIGGICDNRQRICFAFAMWNGRDPILKERLFGLTGEQGNHGEDVKELYYYLDSTPTHSYMKFLYKYPQAEYPYQHLLDENHRRGKDDFEYELMDTGVFEQDRYWDVFIEYAKGDLDDILIRATVVNRGPEQATLHLLPTAWFRNEWSWGHGTPKPTIRRAGDGLIELKHSEMDTYRLSFEGNPPLLFTENESNTERLWSYPTGSRFYKDGFHERIVHGRGDAVNPHQTGTKACAWYQLYLEPGQSRVLQFRLTAQSDPTRLISDFDGLFAQRIEEADQFYAFSNKLSEDGRRVQRQAFAGLLWSKQYYHFVIEDWLNGDPGLPPPPTGRALGRNHEWKHLFNADVISMPDTWEYPWYAAWDLAFHMIPFATIDPDYAKSQLSLFLREWYMHPNGQLPAYEWAFGDVNPPVHAWSCWRVYQIDAKLSGKKDYAFLESSFHKLLMNFTWWVNRKDSEGNNIFEGGFLGLDNIGLFDRSKPLPGGGLLEQSDGTSWMAMYSLNMLKIASELALTNRVYEDVASKFFEHFLYISTAMNNIGDGGLWDDEDGFYYDRLKTPDGNCRWLKVRSMVGLIPLFAVDTLEPELIEALPSFKKRMDWFIENRPDLCSNIASMTRPGSKERRLLSLVKRDRLIRVLTKMLDESEFLSPHGIRSVSKIHADRPYAVQLDGQEYSVDYEPAESHTGLFGGNSNWRGPVWFPVNYLIIESLQKFNYYFGDEVMVEFPAGSGRKLNLSDVAGELSRRLSRIFLRNQQGMRPVFGGGMKFQNDPQFRDYVPFFEYFHGDNGAGLGASHQTGWTGLVAKLLMQSGE